MIDKEGLDDYMQSQIKKFNEINQLKQPPVKKPKLKISLHHGELLFDGSFLCPDPKAQEKERKGSFTAGKKRLMRKSLSS